MTSLFVSHSNRDNDSVEELRQRLLERDYRSLFVDFDPQLGIPAGRDWEAELYRQLKLCRGLIAMVSEGWLESQWCFAELTQARALGKPVFPVRITECDIEGLLTDRQIADVAGEGEVAWDRLWIGLRRAGLDPKDIDEYDSSRPPYPGLDAFQREDAAVYFGRDAEIANALDTLGRMRRRREPRMLAVLGASGSGKSSLVRAGVLPRVEKDTEGWIVVPPFRPGEDPVGALARALNKLSPGEGNWCRIRDRIAAGELVDIARDLVDEKSQLEASVLVVVDQFDELLGAEFGELSNTFLRLLTEALKDPVFALVTLRSDFLGTFQKHPALQGQEFSNITLGPMPTARFPEVIEGPAERAGIEIEAGLVASMVAESETDDALPLLAFALREMWVRAAGVAEHPRFDIASFVELSGIQGSVARVAEDVIQDGLSPADEQALRTAFLKMVRINEGGQYARHPVRWDALPEAALPWIERFTATRLLVTRSDDGQRTVEVVHEALFRVWEKLVVWLDAEREFLLWRRRMRTVEGEWKRTEKEEVALMRGTQLAESVRWMAERGVELEDGERDFIQKSIARRDRDVAERERRRKAVVRWISGVALGFLVIAGIAGFFWFEAVGQRDLAVATLRWSPFDIKFRHIEGLISRRWL